MDKVFKLKAEEIKELIAPMGYCIATDMITVDGKAVGYMYRETPDREGDSGWRFMTGTEGQEYIDEPSNMELYSVNTIANYDPSIIPFLEAEIGSAFERGENGEFEAIEDWEEPGEEW